VELKSFESASHGSLIQQFSFWVRPGV